MADSAPVLSVRVSVSERELLQAAAEQSHTNLSDFVRRKALEAAEIDVLGQGVITIPAEHWAAFEAWVNSPVTDNPKLRRLAAHKPVWQD